MVTPQDLTTTIATATRHGLRLTWLGTAGFRLECDGQSLLLDPYLTRASLGRCLLAPLRSDEDLSTRLLPHADAIVLSHTHFDHALDTPSLALRTGAQVFGSRSAIHLCRAFGVREEQLTCVEAASELEPVQAEVGPFRLRFWPSAHSRFLFGRVPFEGDIEDCTDVPLRTEGYRCGAVFGVEIEVHGYRLFHIGSAELVEKRWQVKPVDLALTCVAGWTSTERYPERLVTALSPAACLFHHWDNFLRPMHRAAQALPAMRFEALVDRLSAASRDIHLAALPLLGSLEL